jgi:hypothetical protein
MSKRGGGGVLEARAHTARKVVEELGDHSLAKGLGGLRNGSIHVPFDKLEVLSSNLGTGIDDFCAFLSSRLSVKATESFMIIVLFDARNPNSKVDKTQLVDKAQSNDCKCEEQSCCCAYGPRHEGFWWI